MRSPSAPGSPRRRARPFGTPFLVRDTRLHAVLQCAETGLPLHTLAAASDPHDNVRHQTLKPYRVDGPAGKRRWDGKGVQEHRGMILSVAEHLNARTP